MNGEAFPRRFYMFLQSCEHAVLTDLARRCSIAHVWQNLCHGIFFIFIFLPPSLGQSEPRSGLIRCDPRWMNKESVWLRFAVNLFRQMESCQVRYGGIRRSSASPRPPCDGSPSASVWPSPSRHQARHARILQIRLHLTQSWSLWAPPRHGPAPRISTRNNPMGGLNRHGPLSENLDKITHHAI